MAQGQQQRRRVWHSPVQRQLAAVSWGVPWQAGTCCGACVAPPHPAAGARTPGRSSQSAHALKATAPAHMPGACALSHSCSQPPQQASLWVCQVQPPLAAPQRQAPGPGRQAQPHAGKAQAMQAQASPADAAAPPPSAATCTAAVEAAACCAAAPVQRSYRPSHRLQRLAVKIPGCHPADLPRLVEGRDWRAALATGLATHGLQLYRVAVRAGCIQLVVDMVHPDEQNAGPGQVGAGPPAMPGQQAQQQQQQQQQGAPAVTTSPTTPQQQQQQQQQQHAPPQLQQVDPGLLQTQHHTSGPGPGGLAVQVMATAAGLEEQLRSGAEGGAGAALPALSPEQLLCLLDPGLVAGRQVLLQADWLQAASPAGAAAPSAQQQGQQEGYGAGAQGVGAPAGPGTVLLQQPGQQNAWLLTCGAGALQLPQQQLSMLAGLQQPGAVAVGDAAAVRHTTLQLASGAQLPVLVQPVRVREQACMDVQAVLPGVVPAWRTGTLQLHVLARVPAMPPAEQDPAALGLLRIGSGSSSSHSMGSTGSGAADNNSQTVQQPSSLTTSVAAQQQEAEGMLECFVRGESGYLPASCCPGRPEDIEHLVPEHMWPQVAWQLERGEWQVLRVQVQLQGPLPPGLLHLEVTRQGQGPLLGRAGLVLVAPTHNMAAELTHLGAEVVTAACIGAAQGLDASAVAASCEASVLLRDLGLLMGCVQRIAGGAQHAAATTSASGRGASAQGSMLSVDGAAPQGPQSQLALAGASDGALPLVAASSGAPAWAHAVAVRLLIAAVARAWPATTALLGDALRVLGTDWQQVEGAALQQEHMSMLHLVVRSGCPSTAAAALAAGCTVGHTWRLTALPAVQHHLTPLHLAAVLPDQQVSAAMVELLLHGVKGAAHAWHHALCGGEPGSSPADMARAVGNMEAVAVAALILGVAMDPDDEPSGPAAAAAAPGEAVAPSGAGALRSRGSSGTELSLDPQLAQEGAGEDDLLSSLQVYQQQQAARQPQPVGAYGPGRSISSSTSWLTAHSSSSSSLVGRAGDGGLGMPSPGTGPASAAGMGPGSATGMGPGSAASQPAPSMAAAANDAAAAAHAGAQLPPLTADSAARLRQARQPQGPQASPRVLQLMEASASAGGMQVVSPPHSQHSGGLRAGTGGGDAGTTLDSQMLTSGPRAMTDGVQHLGPTMLDSMPALHYLSEQQAPSRGGSQPGRPPTEQPQQAPSECADIKDPTRTPPPTPSAWYAQREAHAHAPQDLEPSPRVSASTPRASGSTTSMRTPQDTTSTQTSQPQQLSSLHGTTTTTTLVDTGPAGLFSTADGGVDTETGLSVAANLQLPSDAGRLASPSRDRRFEGEWDLVERRPTPTPRAVRELPPPSEAETAGSHAQPLLPELLARQLSAVYEGEWDLPERRSSRPSGQASGEGATGRIARLAGLASGAATPERHSTSPPRRSPTCPQLQQQPQQLLRVGSGLLSAAGMTEPVGAALVARASMASSGSTADASVSGSSAVHLMAGGRQRGPSRFSASGIETPSRGATSTFLVAPAQPRYSSEDGSGSHALTRPRHSAGVQLPPGGPGLRQRQVQGRSSQEGENPSQGASMAAGVLVATTSAPVAELPSSRPASMDTVQRGVAALLAADSAVFDSLCAGVWQAMSVAGLVFEDPQLEARYAEVRAQAQARVVDRMAALLILLLVLLSMLPMVMQGAWHDAILHLAVTSTAWLPHVAVVVAAQMHAHAGPYVRLGRGSSSSSSSSAGELARNSAGVAVQQHLAAWVLVHRDLLMSVVDVARFLMMVLVMGGWLTYPQDWLRAWQAGLDVLLHVLFKPITAQVRSHWAVAKHLTALLPDAHIVWMASMQVHAGSGALSPAGPSAWAASAWVHLLGALARALAKHVFASGVQVALDQRARRLFLQGMHDQQQPRRQRSP